MQDLPPIGGYEPIQWKRNLPSRGFRPLIYFWGITGLIGFGYYRYYQGVSEQRELSREKQWARIYLEPLLTAEEDRNIARRFFSEKKRQEMVAESMSPETRAKFEEEIYNDKSKFRFGKYSAGLAPSDR
ncbi:uncharacterized protein KQ657_005045 [Scheffersomyces spartinae]|uniref:NADH dehydrogenase [ubiquinone] 1 alpha subcomplex subunit 13 n=1 Tax=Scheffersomyces spartinae TaxID=45513 RepID=A0A9P8AJ64_9ASCO|nr:uncharacterized protein KQ657_005045 [Scheffersomyces spartinae]KAG7193847.1 hypothetical protein KQ657_005045 [Scheffersomyces spartinae]